MILPLSFLDDRQPLKIQKQKPFPESRETEEGLFVLIGADLTSSEPCFLRSLQRVQFEVIFLTSF
jgi:hypothetical protein